MEQKIILSGMGGQGIISLGNLIGISSMFEDKFISVVPSYGAEMRGGMSNCFVTISDKMIGSPVFYNADTGILMYQLSMDKFTHNIKRNGLVIYNENMVTQVVKKNSVDFVGVPANFQAEKIGNIMVANIIMAGAWCKIKKIVKYDTIINAIKEMFKNKSQKIIDLNMKAFEFGYKFVK